ncbi:VaFE repeat-containing surface-anchored protein [Corynebacterium sp. LaCa117]|uniref:VaFE repeat-containing surface-anchored protein n=1 Tax=Corynebacterium sp. LaCa117 TaxID=3391424 RepID=UPI0039899EE3
MSKLRNISREGWMVFTAVLAAIAVIAAMVTVPGGKAEAAEPTDFVPEGNMGSEEAKATPGGADDSWGGLVWGGGVPEGVKPKDYRGNPNNNVGWVWCIDPVYVNPADVKKPLYDKGNAEKADFPAEYHDAAIGLALKAREATEKGDKLAAQKYMVYLIALISDTPNRIMATNTIAGNSDYGDANNVALYPNFAGSTEEFRQLTGYKIVNFLDGKIERDPSIEVEAQDPNAFITVVKPTNWTRGDVSGFPQTVMPVDQPGLPNDGQGKTEEPTTSPENPDTEENTTEETTSGNPGEETSSSETTTESEPSNTEETTPKDSTTEPTSPEETTTEDTGEPTTSPENPDTEENTTEETTSENPGEETSSSETTTESEPSNTEETTPKDSTTEPTSPEETTTEDTGEPTPGKTTDVVPNPDPTPTTEEQEKDLNPEIKTEAKIKDGDRVEKGATVIDTVTYKDLVPGKKYTLKAKLISKKDGETVLGEGSAVLVPEESAGEQDVEITVNDKADPAVDAAVAFEKLVSTEVDKDGNETSGSTDENVIATHENINDEKQTVNTKWTPSIKTNADFANAKQVKAGVTVKDTVTYTDLVPGKEYTLKAELRNKAVNAKGDHEVVGKGDVTFTPEKSAGEQVVDIKVNDDVEGVIKAAVAFEDLYSKQVDENGKETPNSDEEKKITEHRDINDQAQTVTSHKNAIVSTNADFENGSKEVVAGAKIVDQVSYEGLVPGKEYSLDAQLISKKDGKTVLGETKGHTFTPKSANGTEAVTITVNDDVTEPVEAAVAFETLTSKVVNDKGEDTPDNDKPNEIGEHKDINDDDQTVTKKKNAIVSTNADFENGSKEVVAGAKIVDQVSYEGLVPGKEYSLDAQLISKKDGKTVLGETKGHTFTPKSANGTEAVTITVNDDVTEPVEAAVAFETLTSKVVNDKGEDTPDNDKPNEIGEHKDINDDDQTVTKKKNAIVSTNADFENGSKEVVAGAKIVDQVSYEGLVPGKEYSLDAQLISKKDGKTVLGETKGHTFTPKSANGTEAVTITVNDDVTEPVEAAVAFETLTSKVVNDKGEDTPDNDKPNEIGEHKDINDDDQTVTKKKNAIVSTNADFENGSKEVVAGAKIVDQVSYEGLVPGKEYSLDAQLISKKDGKTVLGETKGHTFTPKSANGTEAVTITVNDDVTEPVEAAVAFETLTSKVVNDKGEDTPDNDKPNEIGEHKDIDDEDQTVTSEGSEKTPKITTNADFEKGSHEVIAGAKIVDDVTYEGLVPGKEYTLDAQLISKKDGKTVLGETKGHTFTPKSANGTEAVTITVNDDVKEPVQAAVAFEELTSTEVNDKGEETPGTTPEKPNHIAEHKDINDEDQTVTSHEVHDQDKPGGSSDGSSNGSSNGSSDGSSNGSSKDNKWWLILIPGIGLGKIIKDHFDHKDHGNHNGGHGDNTSSHNGGHGDNTGNHNGGNGHEDKGQDAPKGGNSDNGNGRGVEVQGQQPEETGNALPSNADRVEIKSVPSGATELEPGMQDYIK